MPATLSGITERRVTTFYPLDAKDPEHSDKVKIVYKPNVLSRKFLAEMRAAAKDAGETRYEENWDLVFKRFSKVVISWDLPVSEGEQPIPITFEAFDELGVTMELMTGILAFLDDEQQPDPQTKNS